MPLAYGLIQPVDLCLPSLPARLDGIRVAHVSDLHVRGRRGPHRRLASQLSAQRFDLMLLTGDYMEKPGHEALALDALHELLQPLRPPMGVFGVFGNHDSPDFRKQARDLPIQWLINDAMVLAEHALEIWGFDTQSDNDGADSIAMLDRRRRQQRGRQSGDGSAHDGPERDQGDPPHGERCFRLLLAHSPNHVTVAADLHADLMLSGHNHGGQCRLPTGHALITACDMPLRLVAGVLRHRHTLAAVSRGIGYSGHIPRTFCPPHVPVYTLRRRAMPGQFTEGVDNVQPW